MVAFLFVAVLLVVFILDEFFPSWQSDSIFGLLLKEDVTLTGYGICLTGSHGIVSENSDGS